MSRDAVDYESLVKSIKAGSIFSVYLFYGSEKYLFKNALKILNKKLCNSKNISYQHLDAHNLDAEGLYMHLNTAPMFGEACLFVLDGSEKYFGTEKSANYEEEREIILNYLENINSSDIIVFLTEGKIDKRKKIYKKVNQLGSVVEFKPLYGSRFKKWLQSRLSASNVQMDREALEYLTVVFENNMAFMEQELEKLLLYSKDAESISLEMVKEALSKFSSVNIFEVVDTIGEKKADASISRLREMLVSGESPVFIVYMIIRQFRLMLYVKSLQEEGYSDNKIISKLQLHPYVFNKISKQSKNFDKDSLRGALDKLLQLDIALKTTSRDPHYMIEIAILSLCR